MSQGEKVKNPKGKKKVPGCWKSLAGRMEEEVPDKYKVEESKKGAFKGRGNPSE